MNWQFLFLGALIGIFTVNGACKRAEAEDGSEVKIIGGAEDYTVHTEAVLLASPLQKGVLLCTGTVVRDDLVLTAAHCLENTKYTYLVVNAAVNKNIKPVKSIDRIIFPGYKPGDGPESDIAFVVVPKGSMSGHVIGRIAQKSVSIGERVTLVGYGHTRSGQQDSNEDLKRFVGSNVVGKIESRSPYTITLTSNVVGPTTSGTAGGDSGGPLFNSNGEIVGVTKGSSAVANDVISQETPAFSFYVNVADPGIASFISVVMNDPAPNAATASRLPITGTQESKQEEVLTSDPTEPLASTSTSTKVTTPPVRP